MLRALPHYMPNSTGGPQALMARLPLGKEAHAGREYCYCYYYCTKFSCPVMCLCISHSCVCCAGWSAVVYAIGEFHQAQTRDLWIYDRVGGGGIAIAMTISSLALSVFIYVNIYIYIHMHT